MPARSRCAAVAPFSLAVAALSGPVLAGPTAGGSALAAPEPAGPSTTHRHGADDVAGALAALSAAEAEERARAERWLAVHLAEVDVAEVARALQTGGAATRDALVRVLASEDGLFGLAALLASDVEPEVARHGHAALVGQAARWSPALLASPLADGDLPPDLGRGPRDDGVDLEPRTITLALDRGGFADLVERIDRLALAPVPIVLDPDLHPGVRRGLAEPVRPPRRVTLPWTEVLTTELTRQRLTLRVHGFAPYDDRGLREEARAPGASDDVRAEAALELLREAGRSASSACFLWIGLRGRGADAPGAERLAAWIVTVAQAGGDPNRREAAARTLAQVRWPAATRWLASRWLANGDPAALEGTLSALARGQVEPRLASSAVVRTLLDEVDRRLAADAPGSQRFAERVARALAASSPVDVAGRPLVDDVLLGFDRADATGRWARLVVLEGQRRRAPAAAARARALLADPATPAPLAVQALATLRVVDGASLGAEAQPAGRGAHGGSREPGGAGSSGLRGGPEVARPGALLAAAAEAGLGVEAGEWLARVRARCQWTPAEVEAAREAGPALALLQLAATVRADDAAGSAAWLAPLGEQLADPVRRTEAALSARRAAELELFPEGDARPFVELMRRAAGEGGAVDFAVWRLDAGLGTADERRAALARAQDLARGLDAAPGGAAEALALAAGLVADPELGPSARGLVVALVAAGTEGRAATSEPGAAPLTSGRAELAWEDTLDALTRAADALAAARLDRESAALLGELRTVAGRGWASLADALHGAGWRPDAPPQGRDLDALERRYGR